MAFRRRNGIDKCRSNALVQLKGKSISPEEIDRTDLINCIFKLCETTLSETIEQGRKRYLPHKLKLRCCMSQLLSMMSQGCDLQRGNIYLIKSGLTMRHLSLADRATPLLGPAGRLPSSSPTSSS